MSDCATCLPVICGNESLFGLYSLDSGLIFRNQGLSFVQSCPPGFQCLPGIFPKVVTYPPGTFPPIPVPNPNTPNPNPMPLQIQGCSSTIIRLPPPNATGAQIQALIASMYLEYGQQQAVCDSINDPQGPGLPPPTFVGINDTAFTTTTIGPACFGVAFIQAIVATTSHPISATQDFVWEITSGALPAGLSMSTQGVLAGTPSTAGNSTFTVKITDSTGLSKSRQFVLGVCGSQQSNTLSSYQVGIPYSDSITPISSSACGATFTYSLVGGTLPPGLSLSTMTGEISGVPGPSASGNYTFSIRITGA